MSLSSAHPRIAQRLLRALWITLRSGGIALCRQLRETHRIARDAPIDSDAHFILVPGYRLDNGEIGRRFSRRLQRSWRLCRQQSRQLLLSGYAHDPEMPSEAHAALDYLCDLGLPLDQLIELDSAAQNSRENLLGARRWMAAATQGDQTARLAVVSNRYHLARLGAIAKQLGIDVELVAAEPRWRPSLRNYLAVFLETGAIMTLPAEPPCDDATTASLPT